MEILDSDRRERSQQAFFWKRPLKIHRNAQTRWIPDISPGQFFGFPWFFNTYLPIGEACRERSRRSLILAQRSTT